MARFVRVVVVGALCALPLVAQPTVTSVLPASNDTDASPLTSITIAFSESVDPATINSTNVEVFGRWSGIMGGTFALSGGNTTVTFKPASPFSPGEQVSVMVYPGVQNPQGAGLAATHATYFWVAAAPAQFQFNQVAVYDTRLPGEGTIISYGAYAGDLDNDGFPDLSIPNEASADVRVFMNDGTGTFPSGFTVHSLPTGSFPSANEGADFNGDGWTDLVTANIGGDTVGVFLNDGTGSYLAPVVYTVGDGPRGVAVLDADSDGDTDIVAANRNNGVLSLLRNNGDGTFLPTQNFQGNVSNETSIAVGDANGDGITDIFVGGYGSQNIALLLGNGQGGFTFSDSVSAGGRPWMLASGDVDGDGNIDVAACLSNTGAACVVRSDGNGNLLPAQVYNAGAFTLAIDLGDLDGDGDLDMIASNYSSSNFHVYPNLGNGTFGMPTVLPALGAGSCAIVADLDGDEDMELIGLDEIADKVFIWQTPPLAVQPRTVGAALDVNGSMASSGFGGLAPLPVSLTSALDVTLRGHPDQAYALFVGTAQAAGAPTAAGTINLQLSPLPLLVADGLNGFCPCSTGALGASTLSFPLPPAFPTGLQLTLQAAVSNPVNLATGLTFTNPLTFVTVP